MRWHRDSITMGEINALYETARRAWSEDTRYPIAAATSPDAGQCYVTSYWLKTRLGGSVGKREGHYVWLSPDENYIIDLAPHEGSHIYEDNQARYTPIEVYARPRVETFTKRANSIFENLDKLLHTSLDYMGDALPAEEPQRSSDLAEEGQPYFHDEPNYEPAQGEYQFVYGNGQLEISPIHEHDELLQHAGLEQGSTGPLAVGHVMVNANKATWLVHSNMDVAGLDRIFRDYTKHVGWQWGGITNIDGEPISDDFAPKTGKVLHYIYDPKDEHLYISATRTASELALRVDRVYGGERLNKLVVGTLKIDGRQARVSSVHQGATRSLWEYCNDQKLILYAGNDNQLKTIPDFELGNNYDPNPTDPDGHQYPAGPTDEREPSGVFKCPVCQRLFPSWHIYQDHRRDEANDAGEPEQDGGFPENDMSATFPTHFTEQQPVIMPVGSYEASRVDGFVEEVPDDDYYVAYYYGSPVYWARLHEGKVAETGGPRPDALPHIYAKIVKITDKEPKDLLQSPVPFIYDIQEDTITTGQPGSRTADIPGQFTPGGILEGIYEPGGKVVIKTMTNMPYSVRHMIDLWHYQHPELSVTGMSLQDDSGAVTKLAAQDVGGTVAALAAADPDVNEATKALQTAGGQVFAVGGAVRDALMGKNPKDIDLMVSGLKPAEVDGVLKTLPGQVITTGKDFGVFRYKNGGDDVEIALPRRERSTGAGHRDFHVQADPNMRPEEDLFRRDFSANAMAVNLATGRLVDPYGGADDIQNGVLRAHNPESLSEDPLRVVRALVANARHGLVPEDSTRQQMMDNAASLEHLPPERIQAELDKLFAAENPANGVRLAHETGVLGHLLPEVENCMGYDQNNPHHEYELGDHLTSVLERASQKSQDPDLRLAALLHDIGKPGSQWTDPETGKSHFYKAKQDDGSFIGENHEELGADMTRGLLNRLRYPKDRINRVTGLVDGHMWAPFTTQRGARRFLNRYGDNANDLLDLRWADQGGKSAYPNPAGEREGLTLDKQRNLLDQVRNSQQPTNQSQLAVNGNDLIAAGVPAGPQLGQILRQLTDAVIDNPEINTKDQLLNLAQQSQSASPQTV